MPDALTDDGVRLHYRDETYRDPWLDARNEAILLHHGFAKSLEHWNGFVPSIARRHRVVRFDVRGSGRSSLPEPASEWSVARLVRDALNLVDALEIDKVHWVGAESGGIVGLQFALSHPERIASVGCVNTPYRGSASKAKMTAFFCRGYATPSDAIDGLGYEEWMRSLCEQGVMVDCGDARVVEWVRQQAMEVTSDVAKRWHQVFWNAANPFGNVEQIDVPVLLLAGADHRFGCEQPLLDALRSGLRRASDVVYIPGVGVGVQLLAADACATAYLRFLDGISDSQPPCGQVAGGVDVRGPLRSL